MIPKLSILPVLLLVAGAMAEVNAQLYLSANDLSIATGQPSLVQMSSGSTHVPVWSLSGGTVGQSVSGVLPGLPADCGGVKVEIVVTSDDPATSPEFSDVYRVHLSQLKDGAPVTSGYLQGIPVRTPLPAEPFLTRTIVLEPYYALETPGAPLCIRIQREPGDPGDTFIRPTGLVLVKVTPLPKLPAAHIVQSEPGYNSWPVIQTLGDKLVCVYSRGTAHSIGEDCRTVCARTSTDGGKTWTPETLVADTPGYGEVTIGKGLDSTGAMLLWVRRVGRDWGHDLYRSTDGQTFTKISTPALEVMPVQITDVFTVPTVGLMSLWFAGNYQDGPCSWGTLTSTDDGATWTQHVIESELPKCDWPTEQSAVYLGDGRILAVARSEMAGTTTERAQFQLTSTDYGATWTRSRTNIGDVLASTPSLIYDPATGLLSNYYYHRGRGVLRRRVVRPEVVFSDPFSWPAAEPVALGSAVTFDAGNVNATFLGTTHFLAYYSGAKADTSVVVSEIPAPKQE